MDTYISPIGLLEEVVSSLQFMSNGACVHRSEEEDPGQLPIHRPPDARIQSHHGAAPYPESVSRDEGSCWGLARLERIDGNLKLLQLSAMNMMKQRIKSCKFVKKVARRQRSASNVAVRTIKDVRRTLSNAEVSSTIARATRARKPTPKHVRIITSLAQIQKLRKQLAVLRTKLPHINAKKLSDLADEIKIPLDTLRNEFETLNAPLELGGDWGDYWEEEEKDNAHPPGNHLGCEVAMDLAESDEEGMEVADPDGYNTIVRDIRAEAEAEADERDRWTAQDRMEQMRMANLRISQLIPPHVLQASTTLRRCALGSSVVHDLKMRSLKTGATFRVSTTDGRMTQNAFLQPFTNMYDMLAQHVYIVVKGTNHLNEACVFTFGLAYDSNRQQVLLQAPDLVEMVGSQNFVRCLERYDRPTEEVYSSCLLEAYPKATIANVTSLFLAPLELNDGIIRPGIVAELRPAADSIFSPFTKNSYKMLTGHRMVLQLFLSLAHIQPVVKISDGTILSVRQLAIPSSQYTYNEHAHIKAYARPLAATEGEINCRTFVDGFISRPNEIARLIRESYQRIPPA